MIDEKKFHELEEAANVADKWTDDDLVAEDILKGIRALKTGGKA